MSNAIESRLGELGLSLPEPPAAVANYVPFVLAGGLLYVSGQLSFAADGALITGRLGDDCDLARGQEAARACLINLLAQAKAALGTLERISRCVRLGGYVSATPDFSDHPAVINGASDLLVAVLGERGRHSRAAIGCASLPLGAAVEIEAVFAVEGD